MRLLLKLFPAFLLFLFVAAYWSCKKTDAVKAIPENKNDRFFRVSASAPAQIKAIASAIQKQNARYDFLNSVIRKSGYPVWDKARVVNFDNGTVLSRGTTAPEGKIVYIPFARDSQNYVNSILAVKMNASDTIFRMLHDYKYDSFGFDTTDHSKWDARDVFNMFASFDYSVFGHTKFIINDGRIFGRADSNFTVELHPNLSSGRVSLMAPVEICLVYTMCGTCDGYVRGTTTTIVPGPGCCNPIDIPICTTYWVETGGGDEGDGDGWTGDGDGTGDPGGGGGWGGGDGDPCPGTGPIERTSIAQPGCGPGWEPEYFGESWFNGLAPYTIDVSGLNEHPCAQGLVNDVIALNNSTIQMIKNLYGESTKFNLKFSVDPTLTTAGKTSPVPAYTQVNGQFEDLAYLNTTIKLNPNLLTNGTKLSIVETIIHEMIHAYFNYRMIDAWGDPAKEQALEQELGFLKAYDPNNPSSTAGPEHEQMANSYIDKIVEALKEYRLLTEADIASWKNMYPNITLDDYYKALAWSGLTYDSDNGTYVTKGWKAFENSNPSQALIYRSIIAAEQNGTPLAASQTKCQ